MATADRPRTFEILRPLTLTADAPGELNDPRNEVYPFLVVHYLTEDQLDLAELEAAGVLGPDPLEPRLALVR